MTVAARTVVIGLGNVVMSDDGLGVRTVQRLTERCDVGDDVDVVEGGTAGLLLLGYIADARQVVLVDAIETGGEPGSVVRLDGADWTRAFAVRMTPHDVGLADLLVAARLSDVWPERLVLHGAQPARTDLGTELSPAAARAVDPLVDAIVADLCSWDVPVVRRGGEPLAQLTPATGRPSSR